MTHTHNWGNAQSKRDILRKLKTIRFFAKIHCEIQLSKITQISKAKKSQSRALEVSMFISEGINDTQTHLSKSI